MSVTNWIEGNSQSDKREPGSSEKARPSALKAGETVKYPQKPKLLCTRLFCNDPLCDREHQEEDV